MTSVVFNEQVGNANLLRALYGSRFDKLSMSEVEAEIVSVLEDIQFSDNENQKRYLAKVLRVLKVYKKYLKIEKQ